MIFCTADDGTLESFATLTRKSKEDYCLKHGYRFIYNLLPRFGDMNIYWQLVKAMSRGLAECEEGEWMNFTGADSFILSNAPPCERLLDEGFDLIISKDKNGLNNSGFFLRNSEWSREFLERVWAVRKNDNPIPVYDNGDGLVVPREHGWSHDWYEQSAFIIALREPGMMEHVTFISQDEINHYPESLYPESKGEGSFIVHLPGLNTEARTEYIRSVLNVESA